MSKKIPVAIIGATGFTGSELARILHFHPEVDLRYISSESHAGKKFSEIHPQFYQILDLPLCTSAEIDPNEVEAVFLALPHGVSMDFVEKWIHTNTKIIDLSGDYRLSSPQVYEEWYDKKHSFTAAFDRAVYGMPELHRKAIQTADLVANPGCYPTASILASYPLVTNGIVDPSRIIIDAKSGTTGAGIKPKPGTMYSQVNENFTAYGLRNHRHSIEIQEQLSATAKGEVVLQFTPHLLPLDRGILATVYAPLKQKMSDEQIQALYRDFYKNAPFVRVREGIPGVKEVRGTNFCDIYPIIDERTGNAIVISCIDNLMKGAAGQAVHNFNLMFALSETAGLQEIALKP